MSWGTEAVTIRGILVPVDWDSQGVATKAAILTDREDEYLICEKKKISELLGFMRQIVEVRGVVREEAGRKELRVESWRRTPWDSESGSCDKSRSGGF